MKKNITNRDKQGKRHGKQIEYYNNGNISWIQNFNHGKPNGYIAWFNPDNSIGYKRYYNMDKWIYSEDHWTNQIRIKI